MFEGKRHDRESFQSTLLHVKKIQTLCQEIIS